MRVRGAVYVTRVEDLYMHIDQSTLLPNACPTHNRRALGFHTLVALLAGCALLACAQSSGGGGAPTFSKSYGNEANDAASHAAPTPDGGYVMVGSVNARWSGSNLGDEDFWVAKLDALGDVVWSKVFSENQLNAPSTTADHIYRHAAPRELGGFFLVGVEDDFPDIVNYIDNPLDIVVQRLDENGVTLWTRTYGFGAFPQFPFYDATDSPSEEPHSATPTADGGLLVVGEARVDLRVGSARVPVILPWVLRIDGAGNVVFQTLLDDDAYRIVRFDNRARVEETSDGGAIVLATPRLSENGTADITTDPAARIVRLDSSGSRVWSRLMDDFDADSLDVFGSAPTHGIVVAGTDINLLGRDQELRVLNGDGSDARDGEYADFAFITKAFEFTPPGTTTRRYCAVGRLDSSLTTYNPELQTTRFELIDANMNSTFQLDLVEPTFLAARGFADSGGIGFEFFVGETDDSARRQAHLVNLRYDRVGTFISRTEYPYPVFAYTDLRFGSAHAGWIEGTSDFWTWNQLDPSDVSKGATLTRFGSTSGQIWSRTFSPATARKVESAHHVEILTDPLRPDQWELAVFGLVENSGSFENVYLRLDVDGNILAQQSFDTRAEYTFSGPNFKAPTRESVHGFAQAENGDLLLAVSANAQPCALRLSRDGVVIWCSVPLGDGESNPISIEATLDNGAVVVSPHYFGRVDAAGNLVWRKALRWPITDVFARPDGDFLVAGRHDLGVSVLHFDEDGELLESFYYTGPGLPNPTELVSIAGAEDGGATLVFGAYGPRAAGASVTSHERDIVLLHIDAQLMPVWAQPYGGLLDEDLGGVSRLADGGLIIAGSSTSLGDAREAWLLRTDSEGNITAGCAAAFDRIENLNATSHTDVTAGDLIPNFQPSEDVPGSVFLTPTVAQGFFTPPLVVARQCSGTGDAPVGPPGTFQLSVIVESGAGSVSDVVPMGGTPLLTCTSTCSASFPAGSVVDLSALPAAGFGVPTWTGGDCGAAASSGCSVILDGNRTVRVNFPQLGGTTLFDLNVVFEGAGSGSVFIQPANATFTASGALVDLASTGETFTLTATPTGGSTFGGWTGVDLEDGTFASVTFTTSDRTVNVRFD